jgi:2-iminobutanoate/2-iminopropanoate deaminase
MQYVTTALMSLALTLSALGASPKAIVPAGGAPPVGPYSPGLDAGDYVYVSGQGVRDAQSKLPEGIEAQTKQCIENVRLILAAAGLSLNDVASVQLYLSDLRNLPAVETLYRAAFTSNPPRVILGVARMPTDTTVEITVFAKRPAARADRVYLPAVYGANAAEAQKKLAAELKRHGLSAKQVLFTNHYAVGSTAAGIVPVNALPEGATHALFAVAAKKAPENLAFCEVQASDPTGSIEAQTANVFAKVRACLEGKGMSLANLVATNVYMDDINEFTKMNGVYATFFADQKPTRTTVQPVPPAAQKGSLVRLSAVAAR